MDQSEAIQQAPKAPKKKHEMPRRPISDGEPASGAAVGDEEKMPWAWLLKSLLSSHFSIEISSFCTF